MRILQCTATRHYETLVQNVQVNGNTEVTERIWSETSMQAAGHFDNVGRIRLQLSCSEF